MTTVSRTGKQTAAADHSFLDVMHKATFWTAVLAVIGFVTAVVGPRARSVGSERERD